MPSQLMFSVLQTADDEAVVTVVVKGDPSSPYVADNTHPNFARIVAEAGRVVAGEGDPEAVVAMFDVAVEVSSKFESLSERVSAANGRIYLDGDEIDNSVTEVILRFLEQGVDDWKPLVQFFEKLQSNPQEHSREQLYSWMRNHDVTLTPEGDIVFYKGVRPTSEGGFESINTGVAFVNGERKQGAIPQNIGDVVTMPRSEVAFDPATGCSTGLHCANWRYANSWARGAVLEVHVNPRDVVSVPSDSNAEKVRVCRYVVAQQLDAPYSTAVLPDESFLDDDAEGDEAIDAPELANGVYKATAQDDIRELLEEASGDGFEVEIDYTDMQGNQTVRKGTIDGVGETYVGVITDEGYRSMIVSRINSVSVDEA